MIQEIKRPTSLMQFRIELMDTEPPIWRLFTVASDMKLPELHTAIQIVMGWTDSHLHQFIIGKKQYGEPDYDRDDDKTIDHKEVGIASVFKRKGSQAVYKYDFGDGWVHELVYLGKLDGASEVMDGAMACPPEDSGGTNGYYDLLEILDDPDHEEHQDMLDWIGGEFDPQSFDRDGPTTELRVWETAGRPTLYELYGEKN